VEQWGGVFDNDYGTISGGTILGDVNNELGTISGGTITGNVISAMGTISGGIIFGTVNNNGGTISGGTFYNLVSNPDGTIELGSFCQAQAETGGTVNGGTFGIIDLACYNYPVRITAPSNLSVLSSWSPELVFGEATVCKYKLDAGEYTTIDCSTPTIPTPSNWPHSITIKADDLVSRTVSFIYSTLLGVFTGSITPTSAVDSTHHTLGDLYKVIQSNVPVTSGSHSFTTTAVPANTSCGNSICSITELYIKLANLIDADNLKPGASYLGVTGGEATPTEISPIAPSLSPTTATNTASGFSLEDVYNLVKYGTRITTPSHSNMPSGSPSSVTGHSIEDIYRTMTALIQPGDVAVGTTYLGAVGTYQNVQ
jgi:hypothetical protein